MLPSPTGERTLLLPDQWRDAVVNGGINASTLITILYLDGTIEQAPALRVPRLKTLIEERGIPTPRPPPQSSGKPSPVKLIAKRTKPPLSAPRPRSIAPTPAPAAKSVAQPRPKPTRPNLVDVLGKQLAALRKRLSPPPNPSIPGFAERVGRALANLRQRLTPRVAPNAQPVVARLRKTTSALQQRLLPPRGLTLPERSDRISETRAIDRPEPKPRRPPNSRTLSIRLRQSMATLRGRLFPPRDPAAPGLGVRMRQGLSLARTRLKPPRAPDFGRSMAQLRQSGSALHGRLFPPRGADIPRLTERLNQTVANARKRLLPPRASSDRRGAESLQQTVARIRLRAFPPRDPSLPTWSRRLRQRLVILRGRLTPSRDPNSPRLTKRLAHQLSAMRARLFPARAPGRPGLLASAGATLRRWGESMRPRPGLRNARLSVRPPTVRSLKPVRTPSPKVGGPPLLIGWRAKRIGSSTVEERPRRGSQALLWTATAIVMAIVGGRIALALIPKVIPPPDHYYLTLSGSDSLGERIAPQLVQAWLTSKGGKDVAIVPLADSQGNLIDNERVVFAHIGGHDVQVLVKAHGTGTGFPDLKSGAADIAMSARAANPAEARLMSRLGATRPGKNEHLLALADAAVIVSRANHVPTLTRQQLKGIFSCTIKSWAAIPGVGSPLDAIHVYAPDDVTDTARAFRERVMSGARLCGAKRFTNGEGLEKAVADDPSGIGIVGLANVMATRAVAIGEGRAQASAAVGRGDRSGNSLLAQRLYLYAPASSKNPAALDFLNFALSKAGQDELRRTGATPVRP